MKVLYISYDGLLDPLGASQILPYIFGINSYAKKITVLSFEKKDASNEKLKSLEEKLKSKSITWKKKNFNTRFGLISKLYDLTNMFLVSLKICIKENVDVIHARGHPPALTAFIIKLILKRKIIFDFRGLWVEERIDKGGWNTENLFDNFQINTFKTFERKILRASNHIVVLTNKMVNEIERISKVNQTKVTVIPCSADYDHFRILPQKDVTDFKKSIEIPEQSLIIGYLGSIGGMYKTEKFLKFVEICLKENKYIFSLIITKDINGIRKVIESNFPSLIDNLLIKTANRDEVPRYINAMDVLVNFTEPSYARISMSPTKLGEAFACGKPVICNEGVGDVKEIINSVGGGLILDQLDNENLVKASKDLTKLLTLKPAAIRKNSKEIYSLKKAKESYKKIYLNI